MTDTVTAVPDAGYKFAGWFTTNNQLVAKDSVLIIPAVTSDSSLHAIFQNVHAHMLTFTVANGTSPVENATVLFNGSNYTTNANGVVTITNIPDGIYNYTVTATGYNDATGTITISNADISETVTMTITTCSVIFKDYDGTVLKTETVEYEKSATAPVDPTRTGYSFTGWDTDFSKVTSDLIVTAIYQLVTSITEQAGESIYVYPNPMTDVLYINSGSVVDVSIIDVTGHEIYRAQAIQPGQAIDVEHLKPGIYFVKIDSCYIYRIIKQ
jgi:uncharacterized repeat protein (TIGR02543 family)